MPPKTEVRKKEQLPRVDSIVLERFAPLNIHSLKRNGYVRDDVGQKNKTTRAYGSFLVRLDSISRK